MILRLDAERVPNQQPLIYFNARYLSTENSMSPCNIQQRFKTNAREFGTAVHLLPFFRQQLTVSDEA